MIGTLFSKLFGSLLGKVLGGVLIAALVGGGIYLIKDAVQGYNTLVEERARYKQNVIDLGKELEKKQADLDNLKSFNMINENLTNVLANVQVSEAIALGNNITIVKQAGNYETGTVKRCKDGVIPLAPAMSAALNELWKRAEARGDTDPSQVHPVGDARRP